MKKNLLVIFAITCCLMGCRYNAGFPDCYKEIENEFLSENYDQVLTMLKENEIPERQKTYWYYYFYSISLYNTRPLHLRDSIRYLKIANAFCPDDFNSLYYLGEMYFEIADYRKAAECFRKAQRFQPESIADIEGPLCEEWLLYLQKMSYVEKSRKLKVKASLDIDKSYVELVVFDSSQPLLRKIVLLDYYLDMEDGDVQSYIALLKEKTEDEELLKFLTVKELYLELLSSKMDEAKEIIDGLLTDEDGVRSFKSNSQIARNYFYKYRSFYFYEAGDNVSCRMIFDRYFSFKYRPYHFNIAYQSEDISSFLKEFKKDKEFNRLP